MDDVEVRELRYFLAVAEELNFTRAAARLGMAQPPLSAAIGKLERKLGVMLFERTSRRVALTRAGAVLCAEARTAVAGVGAAVARARRAGADTERLVVAVKPGTATAVLTAVVGRWRADPARPAVRLLFGHPTGPADAVRTGVADVAVARAPFDDAGLDTEALFVEERVAVLPAGHRLAARAALRRADFAGLPMPRWAGRPDPAAAAYWSGRDRPGPAPDADDPEADGPVITDITQLLDAVALGDAVAYVPVSVADEHHRPDLAFVPVTDLTASTVLAAWPADSRSRASADFLRAVRDAASARDDASRLSAPR